MTKSKGKEHHYAIGIAARMLGIRTYALRYYEKVGIIEPSRSRGNVRLYSDRDIAYLRRVRALMEDLGINLAGIEVILRMTQHMTELQHHIEALESELERLRQKQF